MLSRGSYLAWPPWSITPPTPPTDRVGRRCCCSLCVPTRAGTGMKTTRRRCRRLRWRRPGGRKMDVASRTRRNRARWRSLSSTSGVHPLVCGYFFYQGILLNALCVFVYVCMCVYVCVLFLGQAAGRPAARVNARQAVKTQDTPTSRGCFLEARLEQPPPSSTSAACTDILFCLLCKRLFFCVSWF